MGRYPPQSFSVLGPSTILSHSFLLAKAIFEPNIFLYKYPNIFKPSHLSYRVSDPPLPCHPLSCWLRLFSKQTFSPINTPTFSNLVILHTYPPMKMEEIYCSETSAYKIQTPENYPEESIQHSEQGKSLKSRIFRLVSRRSFLRNAY